MISLTLPFISREKYEILKPYSFRTYHRFNSNFTMAIFIRSSISYLAISHDKQSYFILHEYLFNSFYLTQIGKVCTFTPPIWSTISNPICKQHFLLRICCTNVPSTLKFLIISNGLPLNFTMDGSILLLFFQKFNYTVQNHRHFT